MWLAWRALLALLMLPGVVAFLVPWLIVRPRLPDELNPLGMIPFVLGTGLLCWCVATFYRMGRGTLAPWDPPQRLIVTGIYGLTRNPMYAAVVCVLCGWAVAFESWPLAVYGMAALLAFHLRVVLGEEPSLERRHGERWARYKASVPRWLGRVRTHA